MDNQNQNLNQETDILVLLEYFKNGIKKIFSLIGNCFKYAWNYILYFFILLKKYFTLIITCIIIFSLIGYINKTIAIPSYDYEMVICPNYKSAKSVYQLVNSYNNLSGTNKDSFFKNIKEISITPVKSFTNDLTVFYDIINANSNSNKNDTIFSKEYKIESFRKNLTDIDYPYHTIFIKSSKELSPEEIKNKLLAPIDNDPYFSKYREAYLKSLDIRARYYKNNLQKIDTLLLSLAEGDKSQPSTSTLSIKGEAKSNVEIDLLNKSMEISNLLSYFELDKVRNLHVIRIISEPQLVENSFNLIKKATFYFAVYGFIFSLFLIFLLQFIKYLNKFEKEHF